MLDDQQFYLRMFGFLLVVALLGLGLGWLLGPVGWFLGFGLFCTAGAAMRAFTSDRYCKRLYSEKQKGPCETKRP